ncbi:MarR family winged helix-turn-helix transcriptional regulator [Microbispora corallina]|nr:MarR family winged helix-turn-helix transcriptional regulator [Microbispora corallina]
MSDVPQLPPSLLGVTAFLLSKVGVAGRRRMGERLREHGLGLWDFAVLAALRDYGPASQRELGERLGIDPSDLVAVMDTLVPLRLAERRRDPSDRRRYRVAVTDEGRATLDAAIADAGAVRDEVLAALDEEERRTLHALARKALTGLDPRARG